MSIATPHPPIMFVAQELAFQLQNEIDERTSQQEAEDIWGTMVDSRLPAPRADTLPEIEKMAGCMQSEFIEWGVDPIDYSKYESGEVVNLGRQMGVDEHKAYLIHSGMQHYLYASFPQAWAEGTQGPMLVHVEIQPDRIKVKSMRRPEAVKAQASKIQTLHPLGTCHPS